ncbi:MAG: pyridoxamine 5'-phosphate oxidase family protein [Spirochaetales bacterium]|nr:pyridoxamine 5'-phosphate oxidase family protein [Spirochaetales bacterium]
MRRKEKEITEKNEIEQIFKEAQVCRLGLFDGKSPYIVPLNFGYKEDTLYFHSAMVGRKIDILKRNPNVCFEIDIPGKTINSEKACNWSMSFVSIIGEGKVRFLDDETDKVDALNIIMKHYSESGKWDFNKKMMEKTLAFKVKIENISAKRSGTV